MSEHAIGAAQIPHGEGINLDHVAHWLPDLEAGHRALTGLGFITTPYSEQSNRPNPDAPAVPAGAANRCVMLQEGYLEFLTPIGDTDISRELRAGIERYVGLHLMAFGAADAEARHRRFESEGRPLRPLVRLSREIERETGERSTARFSVSRTAPGTMAEGRVQTLTHHTPELLWQPRYVEHPNGITGLRALFVVVSDLAEATARYRDYLRCDPQASGPLQRFPLDRGAIVLLAS
ncbi:MAG: VOC family protein, partial [Pseudomonadota bacterium]